MSIDILLNRPVLQGDLDLLRKSVAEPPQSGARQTTLLMVVKLSSELYALETTAVARVLPGQPIHPIPRRGASLRGGLVNLEGELTLCAPLATLLGLPPPAVEPDPLTQRLVALRSSEGTMCILVDEVTTVVNQDLHTLLPIPVTNARGSYLSCRGLFELDHTLIALLDCAVLAQRLERGFA